MKLRTGFEFYANGGVIGIDDQGNIYEGYDGELNTVWHNDLDDYAPLPKESKIALAEEMIERWTKFKKDAGDAV